MAIAPAVIPCRDRLIDTLSTFIWAQVPVVVIGHPGLAKSTSCQAVFRSFGWHFERRAIPGITDPLLLSGLPSQDDTSTKIKPFPFLLRLLEKTEKKLRTGIIWDDIGEAPRPIQVALLDVLDVRVLSDHQLPLTSMVATANPLNGGLQVTPSMANRVAHLNWTLRPKEQAAMMRANYANPVIPKFGSHWEAHLPFTREQISAFLETTEDFNAPDLDGKATTQIVGAFPSARTWELSARSLAAIDASDMTDAQRAEVRVLALKCLVGETAANAFFTFEKYPNMLKAADALKNPRVVLERKELFDPKRLDHAYIFLTSLCRHVVHDGKADSWTKGWEVLGMFGERDNIPVAALFALVLNKRRPKDAPAKVPQMQYFKEVLERPEV